MKEKGNWSKVLHILFIFQTIQFEKLCTNLSIWYDYLSYEKRQIFDIAKSRRFQVKIWPTHIFKISLTWGLNFNLWKKYQAFWLYWQAPAMHHHCWISTGPAQPAKRRISRRGGPLFLLVFEDKGSHRGTKT